MSARDILTGMECGRDNCACQRSSRNGNGNTHCPAHEDRNPALTVRDKGELTLVHCKVGCSQQAVLAELGKRELWASAEVGRWRQQGWPTAHVRYDTNVPDEPKQVIWEGGLQGTPTSELELFGADTLDGLPDGAEVFVCEGEPATLAASELGLNAVGTACGAATIPSSTVLAPLARFKVRLWADNDDAGRKHMNGIAERLGGSDLSLVTWPDAPPKGDAADLRAAGGSVADLVITGISSDSPVDGAASLFPGRVLLDSLIENGPEPVQWLVPDVLAQGKVHLVYGKPETGKTILALSWVVATLKAGLPVVFVDEESGERDIAGKLREMGVSDVDGLLHYFPFNGFDAQGLEALIAYCAVIQPALIVFDSLTDMLAASGVKENDGVEVTGWMSSAAVAPSRRPYSPAVVLIDHLPKDGTNTEEPVASRAKKAKADVLWHVSTVSDFDRDTMTLMTLTRRKNRPSCMPKWVTYKVGGRDGQLVCEKNAAGEPPSRPGQLSDSEKQALKALRVPMKYGVWKAASKLSKGMFDRSRNKLVERRLVAQDDATQDWYQVSDGDGSDTGFDTTSIPHLKAPPQQPPIPDLIPDLNLNEEGIARYQSGIAATDTKSPNRQVSQVSLPEREIPDTTGKIPTSIPTVAAVDLELPERCENCGIPIPTGHHQCRDCNAKTFAAFKAGQAVAS